MPETRFIAALLVFLLALLASVTAVPAGAAVISDDTQSCLDCHSEATPAIVADWKASRHAKVSVTEALAKSESGRRVSVGEAPEDLGDVVVGCAECHGLKEGTHPDSFDHEGFQVHTVVSPPDCATCHPREAEQYEENKMSRAVPNLLENPLYMDLVASINSTYKYENGTLSRGSRSPVSDEDSCLSCHGTVVRVEGKYERSTDFGDFEFPKLTGWPNNGVGRINPDESRGSCAACHTRHLFSVKTARDPSSCTECHKGPDVPADKIYGVSKHGALYYAHKGDWDFDAVPWVVGRDFSAPTCAVCHISRVENEGGTVLASRTHRMNDRLAWRLFGLVYSHRQPVKPDTSVIRNQEGLPLPTDFSGREADQFLIEAAEVEHRVKVMKGVCLGCHSGQWVDGHWVRLENAKDAADEAVATATRIMQRAWDYGVAAGPLQKSGMFDEALERMWVEQWLFYANSVRLASAMLGADYGVFDNGRWNMTTRLHQMSETVELRIKASKNKQP